MKKMLLTLAALTVAAALFTGCTQSKPAEQPKAEAPKQEEPAKAGPVTAKSADGKLEVKVSAAGAVAMVEMKAQGFTWNKTFAAKEPKEPKNAPGEGHAILTLDGGEPMYVGTMRYALKDLKPGKHTLKVQLVNNDNSPLGTEVSVDFEVK
ncbi:MAG: hypothetical protein ACOY94_12180 [Bacillota bacterium]